MIGGVSTAKTTAQQRFGREFEPFHVKINDVNPVEHERSNRPFLSCKFVELRTDALVDTGAFMSVMNTQFLEKLQSRPGNDIRAVPTRQRMTAASATGHHFAVKGVFSVPFVIQSTGHEMAWPFLVVDDLTSEVILGSEFLASTDAEIIAKQKHVHWPRGFVLPERRSSAYVRTQREVHIQAMSTLKFAARITAGINGQIGVCCRSRHAMIEAISQIDDKNACDVVIANNTHEAIHIPKGTKIGQFVPVREQELVPLGTEIPISTKPGSCVLSKGKREYLHKLFMEKNMPAHVRQKLWAIIERQHEAFSEGPFDLGYSDEVSLRIRMRHDEPVHVKQFPIPWAHREKIDTCIQELLKKGCIEQSRSPYNSPMFGVPKKDGSMRMVLDYRKINESSLEDKHVIKEVQDCVDTVGVRGSTFFSTLDLTSGFWQQNLEEKSRQYSAFTIPGQGRFQWKRVPMGLAGSPAAFSRLIEDTVRGLDGVQGYLDDLLVHSPTLEGHYADLEKCLIRLRRSNLKLNMKKCDFLADEVPYLGFTLTKEGVLPGKQKLRAVSEFPTPKTIKEVRQYTGLTNYFRHMIPGYASRSGHLTRLLTKESKWEGGELPPQADKAFHELKNCLCSAPILAFPNPRREFILSTDAALGDATTPGGLGAVLSQKDDNGIERVIAYASRSLRANEKNYSAFLVELTAIVWAIDHFHVYLYGNRFKVITDHKPLETMKAVHKKTLNRLQERLIDYNFTLTYRPGRDNGPADALSRNPVDAIRVKKRANMKVSVTIQRDQALDPDCASAREKGGPYVIRQGILYRYIQNENLGERECVVLPRSSRRRVLQAAHDSPLMGHQGVTKTYHQVLSRYWWPNMQREIQEYVKTCHVCQQTKDPQQFKRSHAPHKPLPIPEMPNTRVHMDLFGPLTCGSEGHKYVMVMTDALTRYAEMVPIRNKEAGTVADALYAGWICRHSVPKEIVSDRGKEFHNQVMRYLLEKLGIEIKLCAVAHPQANAHVEIINKSIANYMKAMMDTQATDWVPLLAPMQFAYNNRVHESTMHTPFFLMHGYEARIPEFSDKPNYAQSHAADRLRELEWAINLAKQLARESALRNKAHTDKTSVTEKFNVGEDVWVKFDRSIFAQKLGNAKFARPWHHYVVKKKAGDDTYIVAPKLSGGRSCVVHKDRIKAYKGRTDTSAGTYGSADMANAAKFEDAGGEHMHSGQAEKRPVESRTRSRTHAELDTDVHRAPRVEGGHHPGYTRASRVATPLPRTAGIIHPAPPRASQTPQQAHTPQQVVPPLIPAGPTPQQVGQRATPGHAAGHAGRPQRRPLEPGRTSRSAPVSPVPGEGQQEEGPRTTELGFVYTRRAHQVVRDHRSDTAEGAADADTEGTEQAGTDLGQEQSPDSATARGHPVRGRGPAGRRPSEGDQDGHERGLPDSGLHGVRQRGAPAQDHGVAHQGGGLGGHQRPHSAHQQAPGDRHSPTRTRLPPESLQLSPPEQGRGPDPRHGEGHTANGEKRGGAGPAPGRERPGGRRGPHVYADAGPQAHEPPRATGGGARPEVGGGGAARAPTGGPKQGPGPLREERVRLPVGEAGAQHLRLMRKAALLVEHPGIERVEVTTKGPVTRLTAVRSGKPVPERRPDEYLVPKRPLEYAQVRANTGPKPRREDGKDTSSTKPTGGDRI